MTNDVSISLVLLNALLAQPTFSTNIAQSSAYSSAFGVSCTAKNSLTGQLMLVTEIQGPSLHWAHAWWQPNGNPTITYSPSYFALPDYMRIWTSAHECGHLTLQTPNEIAANCFALQRISPSPNMFNLVANFHRSIGPLPPQYGGNGVAFWNLTISNCL